MLPVEIEVKFYIRDMEQIRNRIRSLGAIPGTVAFEKNIRFENDENTLLKRNSLLRLRKSDRSTLTYKSRAPVGEDQFKIHTELEVMVNDFDTMHKIMTAIGFHPEQVYEKKRETFLIGDTTLCLDLMPYGAFIEIEGTREGIRHTAQRLGLEWKDRILFNYLEMFEVLKQRLDLTFSDVTFDNFKNIQIDFGKYLYLFTAG